MSKFVQVEPLKIDGFTTAHLSESTMRVVVIRVDYTYSEAIALRDWLTEALGEAKGDGT